MEGMVGCRTFHTWWSVAGARPLTHFSITPRTASGNFRTLTSGRLTWRARRLRMWPTRAKSLSSYSGASWPAERPRQRQSPNRRTFSAPSSASPRPTAQPSWRLSSSCSRTMAQLCPTANQPMRHWSRPLPATSPVTCSMTRNWRSWWASSLSTSLSWTPSCPTTTTQILREWDRYRVAFFMLAVWRRSLSSLHSVALASPTLHKRPNCSSASLASSTSLAAASVGRCRRRSSSAMLSSQTDGLNIR
mmetsp:Transcript_3155/g.7930  ORF Transcript_3155/g.7930 Transcript_3155/m.7930 type:complete len:247 (+) Transcript_3155:970-1710(+)